MGISLPCSSKHAWKPRPGKNRVAKLGEVLVSYNFIQEKKLLEILSVQLGVPLIEIVFVEFDLSLITVARLKSFQEFVFLPIRREGEAILAAFADPGSQRGIETAENIFECRIIPGIARESAILKMIRQFQADIKKDVSTKEIEVSIPEIVDTLILDAIALGVSDIHIEPLTDRLRIRFRQDGVLIHYKDYPREIIPALSSRLKVMCQADIAEKRRHQGGRIDFKAAGEEIDLRVFLFCDAAWRKDCHASLETSGPSAQYSGHRHAAPYVE